MNKGGTTVKRPCNLATVRFTGTFLSLSIRQKQNFTREMIADDELGYYPAKFANV
ncbi:hypothetical protein FD12_GL001603 [Lentilactobacillus rapi DSM 19907 = JCM 15042]|uniref:Uncharacterized protein n=2 Tax=Lentilactobacillus rapi TaxID=481723 RepID=A0A512PNY0_9LACO|nr:hypothetical protein FD12_GL001603 [Lentilactobacillus rapi DSM 19907 = JCM 15042]GEP72873.1 hypothetical protein LRA02_17410 [Lentilactobacillus rapi]